MTKTLDIYGDGDVALLYPPQIDQICPSFQSFFYMSVMEFLNDE
jgi:hypothetical protein